MLCIIMKDKVIIVTGSSSGIGEATVKEFAKLGCKVVVHGTDKDRVHQVATNCQELSPNQYRPLEIIGDLRDGETVANLITETLNHFNQLDILVNNAGLFQPTTIDQPDAYRIYSDMIKINLDSVVMLTSLAVPHLKKTKGCIVNISSNLHSKCMPGGFAYCTAKAGLTMFTKSIAVDLAPDVRVNSVSPGPVASMMPARCGMNLETYRRLVGSACLVERVGEPIEIARVVLFLASPDAAFITGSDMIVDGGSTIKPEGEYLWWATYFATLASQFRRRYCTIILHAPGDPEVPMFIKFNI